MPPGMPYHAQGRTSTALQIHYIEI